MKNEIDSAEALLQALIADCRAVIRDVVLPYAHATRDDGERRRYLDSAVDLVKIGAAVGDAIGRLRGGQPGEQRQRIIVERIQTLSNSQGEGG
ncbi:MAG TPA: hypothetical protein VGC16_10455 [Rhizomicrobium sp.]